MKKHPLPALDENTLVLPHVLVLPTLCTPIIPRIGHDRHHLWPSDDDESRLPQGEVTLQMQLDILIGLRPTLRT